MVLWIPAKLVREVIPDYLKSIPIPYGFSDIKSLSVKDVLHLAALSGAVAGTIHYGIQPLLANKNSKSRINNAVKLEVEKVVDVVKISEFDDGQAKYYCRCWKSKKFPFCDGAHAKHNKETGDNIGPLAVKNE